MCFLQLCSASYCPWVIMCWFYDLQLYHFHSVSLLSSALFQPTSGAFSSWRAKYSPQELLGTKQKMNITVCIHQMATKWMLTLLAIYWMCTWCTNMLSTSDLWHVNESMLLFTASCVFPKWQKKKTEWALWDVLYLDSCRDRQTKTNSQKDKKRLKDCREAWFFQIFTYALGENKQ